MVFPYIFLKIIFWGGFLESQFLSHYCQYFWKVFFCPFYGSISGGRLAENYADEWQINIWCVHEITLGIHIMPMISLFLFSP